MLSSFGSQRHDGGAERERCKHIGSNGNLLIPGPGQDERKSDRPQAQDLEKHFAKGSKHQLSGSQQTPRPQHALDRVGRGFDFVVLGALGGGDQPLDRDFEHAPACDGREPLGE